MTLSSLQDWQRADFFLEGGDGYMSIKKIAEKAGVSPGDGFPGFEQSQL